MFVSLNTKILTSGRGTADPSLLINEVCDVQSSVLCVACSKQLLSFLSFFFLFDYPFGFSKLFLALTCQIFATNLFSFIRMRDCSGDTFCGLGSISLFIYVGYQFYARFE